MRGPQSAVGSEGHSAGTGLTSQLPFVSWSGLVRKS